MPHKFYVSQFSFKGLNGFLPLFVRIEVEFFENYLKTNIGWPDGGIGRHKGL